jgi:hypothetical protein
VICGSFQLALFGAFLTTAWPKPVLFSQSGGEPGSAANVKLPPALITWLFRKTCATRSSGGVGFLLLILIMIIILILILILILISFPPRFPRPLPFCTRLEWSGRSHRPLKTRGTQLAPFVAYSLATIPSHRPSIGFVFRLNSAVVRRKSQSTSD